MNKAATDLVVALQILLACTMPAVADQVRRDECALSSLKSGQMVTLRGKIVRAPHDMTLELPGCEEHVVLVFARETDQTPSESAIDRHSGGEALIPQTQKITLQRDRELKRFEKYVGARYPSTKKDLCLGCYKYDVEATFSGVLEISERAGFRFNEGTEKIVGAEGFGHPAPFARYRLTIESVSGVAWKKLDRSRSAPDAE